MAIIILEQQRRLRQLGEIRLGELVTSTGKTGIRPAKLSKFRLTSPDRQLLEGVADLYGGTVQAWTPPNGGPAEWEVYTEADRLPVIVPPNSISQWFELYKGPQCVRRCDGVTEQKTDKPCMCDPDPEKRQCATTTRLNVMLRDVAGTGTWLLTTHGYYAAIELPGMADLLSRLSPYAPCTLGMEQRRVIRANGKPADIVVPTLDLAMSPGQLLAGDHGGPAAAIPASPQPQAIGGQRTALPAAPTPAPAPDPVPDYKALAYMADDAAGVRAIWEQAKAAGHLTETLKGELTTIGRTFAQVETNPQPAADEPVEAEIVDDAPATVPQSGRDADTVWGEIVRVAGSRTPPWTMPQLHQEFHGWAGMDSEHASADLMKRFLHLIKTGEELPA